MVKYFKKFTNIIYLVTLMLIVIFLLMIQSAKDLFVKAIFRNNSNSSNKDRRSQRNYYIAKQNNT